jgi:probable F420-dependent oxidoreductase
MTSAVTGTDLKMGVVYPQLQLGDDPTATQAFGLGLDALGYDHLMAFDHVIGAVHADRNPPLAGPYTEEHPFHDPLVMFAFLAGQTSRLEFVTGVLVLPQRQTALLARQAADLALLSGGRFRLGVGVGWNYAEYDTLGQDFATRGPRLTEQVELLRRLWTEPVVDATGRFDRFDRIAIVPKPTEPVPIWFGGFRRPAFERAARLGDGFIFAGSGEVEVGDWDVAGAFRSLRDEVERHGRSPEDFGGERVVMFPPSVEHVAAKVHEWADAGGTHASVLTLGLGLDSVDAHLDYLARVKDAVQAG